MSSTGEMAGTRVVILGNAGSGKTTLARRLAEERGLARLDLDGIAWGPGPVRRPLAESILELERFTDRHRRWVVEGSYASLAEAALARADELLLLDPGVERCLTRCRERPWEPDKYPSPAAQDEALGHLLEWVARYDEREDEYGRAAHQALFERFTGAKRVLVEEA